MKSLGALISIAGRFAKCSMLDDLYEVCENNKTISTRKLQRIVYRLEDSLKEEGAYIRKTHDRVRQELAQTCKRPVKKSA